MLLASLRSLLVVARLQVRVPVRLRVLRRVVVVAAAGAGLLVTTPARAGSPCELRFEGAVPPSWSAAAHDVGALASRLTSESTDCRVITVTPDGEGASVVFTTADGRRARRRVAQPRELLPMVQALLVFDATREHGVPLSEVLGAATPDVVDGTEPAHDVPAANDEETEGRAILGPARPAPPESPPGRDAPVAAARARALGRAAMVAGAGGGAKASFPHDSVAAVGQIFAGVTFSSWELAGFGRWEIEHDAPADASAARVRYSALGGGLMFGRRQAIGPLVLVGGVRAAAFDAEEESGGGARHGEAHHEEFLDPRLGLYAGCLVSQSDRLRVRVQVDGDAGLLVHQAELAQLPAFPRWNLGISLGAEAGFLP